MDAWERVLDYQYHIESHAGVIYDNRAFVICGEDSDHFVDLSLFAGTLSGVNGDVQIMPVPGLSTREYLAACVFDKRMFVSGGQRFTFPTMTFLNDVLMSRDGKSWETICTLPVSLSAHSMLEFNNKLVILGGLDAGGPNNSIHTSPDGVNWTEVLPQGNLWSARFSMGCLVYKNKLWVIGGEDASDDDLNDVWWTDDLVHWHRAIEHAPWEGRCEHICVEFDERIWIAGGDGDDLYTDVWYSRDGSRWERSFDLPYHICESFAGVINNHLHIFGGYNNPGTLKMNLG